MTQQRTTREVGRDIQATADEYTTLRREIADRERTVETTQAAEDATQAQRVARASSELGQLRQREGEITARLDKLNTELEQAREREAQQAAQERAERAPAIREALESHRKASERFDEALAELEAAWQETDTATREMLRLIDKDDGHHLVNKLRHERPIKAALMTVATGDVPLTRRVGLETISLQPQAFRESTQQQREAIERIAQRYENATTEAA